MTDHEYFDSIIKFVRLTNEMAALPLSEMLELNKANPESHMSLTILAASEYIVESRRIANACREDPLVFGPELRA